MERAPMPLDGKAFDERPAFFSLTDESRGTPLLGLAGGEWRGFIFGLTGIFALVLGMTAALLSFTGP